MSPRKTSNRAATFRSRIGQWQKQVGERADQLTQGVANVLFDNVHDGGTYSPGTPIEDGEARSAWSAKVGRLSNTPPAGSPEEARDRAFAEILMAKVGDPVFLMNNAHHIRRLEFGWSQQAPQGFVRLAVNSTPQIADQVVRDIVSRGERGRSG